MALNDRLWSKVDRSSGPYACWPFTASLNTRGAFGYGELRLGSRRILAHRLAWITEHGPIPAGLCVLHRCDNPPCCNPAHLFLGTKADNMHDRKAKGRYANACKGERHRCAKLTSAAVLAMRRLHAAGATSEALGRMFGVGTTTAHRAATGRTWKHL